MRPLLLAALAVLLPLAAGCDDAVDPTLGTDQAFTLYGVLDPTADRQALRVIPIADRLDPAAPDSIDAEVVSIENGVETAWDGTVVTFGDGTIGHVFVADYTPRPGATVRVEARRSDGAVSSAEVTVPTLPTTRVLAPDGAFAYPVVFEDVPRVSIGRLEIDAVGLPGAPPGEPSTVSIDVDVRPQETAPGRWEVLVPFAVAVREYLLAQQLVGSVTLEEARYVGFVTSREWEIPEGGFDPDVIVEPGTQSNVAGGFGYVGAGYEQAVSWSPSVAAQQRAGFVTSRDAASALVINEIGLAAGSYVEFYNPTLEPVDISGYSLRSGAAPPEASPVPPNTVVPGGGFRRVPLQFDLGPGDLVTVFSPGGAARISRGLPPNVDLSAPAYGSYPDGLLVVVQGNDVFGTAMPATPGAPNRPPNVPAVINEVRNEGPFGWVEVVATDTEAFTIESAEVFGGTDGVVDGAERVVGLDNNSRFGAAFENGDRLVLPPGGTRVVLRVTYRVLTDGVPPGPFTHVTDFRDIGPQTPGTSSGYLPDGPGGAWTNGLRPTLGGPNAGARPAL